MSYHILHLLSHNLKVRIKLDQLHITDMESGTDKSVPLADVAVIVCAARDTEFSGQFTAPHGGIECSVARLQ